MATTDSEHERTITGATLVDSSPLPTPSASAFSGISTIANGVPSKERIIPPEHPYRTLVLCFDGTGDQFDSDNSNIVEFFSLLKKDDRTKQMVYYQAGIGTYTTPQIATPFMAKISKTLDEMIAWNLDSHVMGGYEFLMQNYSAGDRICIFGFSRGAYTARSLAGMIHKVGILPACNHQQVPFAYKMFTQADEVGWEQSNAFKKAFSIDADIEFIGVWDTVNSVGLIPKRLPFTTSNTIVRTFRHAVSLDERRAKFKANLWNRPNDKEAKLGISSEADHPKKNHDSHQHCRETTLLGSIMADVTGKDSEDHSKHKHTLKALERKFSKDRNLPTDIEEVWFSGCHCDVGGGSVSNDTKPNLARIPLRWMIRECFKTNTGIMFDADLLEEVMGMDPAALYPNVLPRPPPLKITEEHVLQRVPKSSSTSSVSRVTPVAESQFLKRPTEEELELADALSPVYDQLSMKWFWWLLEFWPVRMRYQRGDKTWMSKLGWNLGRGRVIPKQKTRGVKVHRSVKMRLEAKYADGKRYTPKAAFDERYVTWVD